MNKTWSFKNKNGKKKERPSLVGRLSQSKLFALAKHLPGGGGGSSFRSKQPKTRKGKPPPKIDIYADVAKEDPSQQGHAQMSDRAKATQVAPRNTNPNKEENWDFLYELASQYEKLKLQEVEEMKNPNKRKLSKAKQQKQQTSLDDDSSNNNNSSTRSINSKKKVKKKLAGIFGGRGTNYTASGTFLNDAYFDQYFVEDPRFSSVTFDFSNESQLYKRFNRKDQEQRSISQKFVAALMKHPCASKITHLALSNALLPDAFLVALAEACFSCATSFGDDDNNNKKPSTSFLPMLQVLNLESNVLGKDGIAALSKCIADPGVWPRLQVLKLENQKSGVSSQGQEALGNAIVTSQSLVVVGLQVREGIPKQQIGNTIKANVDKLRQARRKHASKKGTLKARKRNEMEVYFDEIASNKFDANETIVEVDLKGHLGFLGLKATEKTKSGVAFGTNTTVKTLRMVKLGLGDDFARALGNSLASNITLETIVLDSNSFSGTGMKALVEGLGKNTSIKNFQVRHQSKTMSSSDEETLPGLLEENQSLIKLGVDVRNPLIKMKLDRKTNANSDHQRKLRVAAAKK